MSFEMDTRKLKEMVPIGWADKCYKDYIATGCI